MPRPLALCIERLDASADAERYVRCVADTSVGHGLTLDGEGNAAFGRPGVCDLVVSLDERLLLIRQEGATPVVVHRAGRCLEAPVGQRVVLVDQDQLEVGARRLRVHIHGPSREVHPPQRLSVLTAASLAAVMALGAGGCCKELVSGADAGPIEVRDMPPIAPPPQVPPQHPDAADFDASVAEPGTSSGVRPPKR